MLAIVVRGATGVTVFTRIPTGRSTYLWRCSRGDLDEQPPADANAMVNALIALQQHAVTHGGATQQVVELTL